jgi:hypothetical protein
MAVHDGAWCVGQLAHQSNGLVRKKPDPGELAFPGFETLGSSRQLANYCSK